ncbi:DinB family protein [Mucilaginibacter pedocola]|uniref:Damage-inducible protein DinB n=1 Tax=Mucilaginibacter pedocola TaxID=1792845 RepID=A0A1S9P9H0_9SPHI|nr:DinB family protein [Mucilaginibacter pedocola]OOQ57626.1 damage-inducible protein DinB [Mucilaginibacter pedocola]
MENQVIETNADVTVITAGELLSHWQGHRKLSRKVLNAFPENELFGFSIGGMRTYAALAKEIIGLTSGGISGIVTGDWSTKPELDYFDTTADIKSKAELLAAWDEVTEQLDTLWPQIPAARFAEVVKSFGQWDNTVIGTIQYVMDNEIHHRAQGTVYLRALGIEPPAFWERW